MLRPYPKSRRKIGRFILVGFLTLIVVGTIWVGSTLVSYPSALKIDHAKPQIILIDNVRIVSMVPEAPIAQDDMAVLIVGDRIEAVEKAGALAAPPGAATLDGGGRTLIPGLIDAHVHVWDEAELAGYLAHGVTGIRNLSGMPFHVRLAKRIESGRILGPDFLTSGPILNSPGPNQQANHKLVETAEEARKAVRQQHQRGYHFLKVYSNLRREPYLAILDEAARLKMPVAGHTPEGFRSPAIPDEEPFAIPFDDALSRDFVTIEHVESIAWHGLRGQLDGAAMRQLSERIAQSGIAVTPTLIAHDNLVRVAESNGAYLDRPGVDTINPFLLFMDKGTREYWSAQDPETREGPRAKFFLEATLMLHNAGVPLVLGTDAGIFTNIPGSSATRELELLVRAGLTPLEALASATRISADKLGFERTGQIKPGFRANLVLLDGDPLSNISVVEEPSDVWVRGYWLPEEDLSALSEGARQTSFLRSALRAVEMVLNQ